MRDQNKTKRQLIAELEELRQRFQHGPVSVENENIAATAISEDDSEQKRAQESLLRSERRLLTLMSNLPGMVYRCKNDLRWTMEFVSDGCINLLGYEAAQMIGPGAVHLGDMIHPDDRQSVWDHVQQGVAQRRRYQLEYRVRTAGGQQKWAWEQGSPVFSSSGELEALEGFITDITEGKNAEEALKKAHDELEQRVAERTAELSAANEQLQIFRMFTEASGQGFGMADLNGTITYWNPTLCRLFGEENPENVVGKHVTSYYPEEYFEKRQHEILPALVRGGHSHIELVIYSRQGKATSILQNAFLIRDENGNPVRLAAAITDITELKRAQAAMEREQTTLKHMLQASDHERQLIAYDIHDGLAQYLTGAIMQLDVADQQRSLNPTEASKAHDAGMLMVRQSLAETRRLISGVRPPILDESGIVAAVAHLVYEHRGRNGPKIEFRSKVDFGRLDPVFENAIYRIAQEGLTNAWKHSNSKKVCLGLIQRGDHVRVIIQDRGVGFDPKIIQEGRFGLEGIRQRARLLGGKALIDSTPGKGTRIIVDLPIVLRSENRE